MDSTDRLKILLDLAKCDSIYQLWTDCYRASKSDFEAFANAQPEHIRSFLWGYAESGRLIYQRLANIACKHMVFLEETDSPTNSTDHP